ncbi:MAG TPA: hypothetical protein VFK09_07205 [Gemmatimonadales bacterium]|nr:hypothetical protein [Gemmatimonadales bacterium]
MRTRLPILVAPILVLAACSDTPTTPVAAGPDRPLALGNGFPKGGHDFSVHLIGVPKDKSATMDNNDGRRIFVQLDADNEVTSPGGKNNQLAKGGGNDQNHIYLCNSTDGANDVNDARCDAWRLTHAGDFGVIDANATDADGGMFGLPDPCSGDSSLDGCTPAYGVWARALTPGGSVIMTTCADETGTGFDGADDVWCGSNGITLSKQSAFKAIDVTNNLLRMTITLTGTDDGLENCINGTTGIDYPAGGQYTISLFDRCFENYFWNYDNNGLKNLELRFYSQS